MQKALACNRKPESIAETSKASFSIFSSFLRASLPLEYPAEEVSYAIVSFPSLGVHRYGLPFHRWIPRCLLSGEVSMVRGPFVGANHIIRTKAWEGKSRALDYFRTFVGLNFLQQESSKVFAFLVKHCNFNPTNPCLFRNIRGEGHSEL